MGKKINAFFNWCICQLIHLRRPNYDTDNVILNLTEASLFLQNQHFRMDFPTVLYIHGYTESTQVESVRTVTNAYLTNGGYNTLVLDWGPLAGGLYTTAFRNVDIVGERMVDVLLGLFSDGLGVEEFHLVGHSLGGQMAGVIGKGVQENSNQQIVLERITALDPAGPLYYELLKIVPLLQRPISASDALFVDVIHTDAGFLGQAYSGGHVDFWPNSGTRFQPGCPILQSLISLNESKYSGKYYNVKLIAFNMLFRFMQSHSILDVLVRKYFAQ